MKLVRSETAIDDWSQTEKECEACGESICFTEDVLRFTLVFAHMHQGELLVHPIFTDDGEYQFEPAHVHLECAESFFEDLDELVEDVPPLQEPGGILQCCHTKGGGCRSDILPWERFALIEIGELYTSRRSPGGSRTTTFRASGAPNCLCLACTHRLNGEIVTMWPGEVTEDNPIRQDGECEECTHKRCWRIPSGCTCECHP